MIGAAASSRWGLRRAALSARRLKQTRNIVRLNSVVSAWLVVASGQTPERPALEVASIERPAFEVVSIRPIKPSQDGGVCSSG